MLKKTSLGIFFPTNINSFYSSFKQEFFKSWWIWISNCQSILSREDDMWINRFNVSIWRRIEAIPFISFKNSIRINQAFLWGESTSYRPTCHLSHNQPVELSRTFIVEGKPGHLENFMDGTTVDLWQKLPKHVESRLQTNSAKVFAFSKIQYWATVFYPLICFGWGLLNTTNYHYENGSLAVLPYGCIPAATALYGYKSQQMAIHSHIFYHIICKNTQSIHFHESVITARK